MVWLCTLRSCGAGTWSYMEIRKDREGMENMTEKLLIQSLILPHKDICEDERMYISYKKGKAVISDDCLYMKNGEEISTFTYFNSLSVGKWKKYTNIKDIYFYIEAEGKYTLRLMHSRLSDGKVVNELVCEENIDTDSREICELRYTDNNADGIYYAEITAHVDTVIYGGGYKALPSGKINDIELAIGICTFKREEYVLRNINSIKENIINNTESAAYGHVELFVSDNGNTLDIDKINDEGVNVFYNKNAGGAGGFTRCIMESLEAQNKKFTHMLLMDDDIKFEPEIICRTYILLKMAKAQYLDSIIGGSLLRLDMPDIQHAGRESWGVDRVVSQQHGYDMTKEIFLHTNEKDIRADYNGWWYCVISLKDKNNNLPLPIFIHGDDIEYGLRQGKEVISVNGIGVWHDAGDNRKSSVMEYYDMRNLLILTVIHNESYTKKQAKRRVLVHLTGQLIKYRYEDQLLTIKGVEDFLKGVEFLYKTDPIALHSQISSSGYKTKDVSKYIHDAGKDRQKDINDMYKSKLPDKKKMLMLNGWLFPAEQKCKVLPMGCSVSELYRTKKVVYYDPDTLKGFCVKKQLRQIFITMYRYIKIARKIDKHFDRAKADYRKNWNKIVSNKFWKRYLEC